MDDGIPQPPKEPSLAAGLSAGARGMAGAVREWLANRPAVSAVRRDWIVAGALALLIAAGPLLTIIAGSVAAGGVRAEVARLQEQAAPRAAAAKAAAQDRAALVTLLKRPSLGVAVEALARALPADAVLIRLERNRQGLIEADIAAPDPDRLRAAIRAEPALARLRDVGQRQHEAMMTVSFRERGE